MIPLIAAGEMNRLKKGYTTVTQKDIFTVNPFLSKIKNGKVKFTINPWTIIDMFLKNRHTFGSSYALRETIKKSLRVHAFNKIKNSRKDVVVCVTNLTLQQTEYKSIKKLDYEDFIDWSWISANLVPFMSLVEKDGYDYADGGIVEYAPIQEAINRGATEIDVIMLRTEKRYVEIGSQNLATELSCTVKKNF